MLLFTSKNNRMKYTSILIEFNYKAKKHLSIRKISSRLHATKKQALGYVYNSHQMRYMRERKNKQIIISNFQWGWIPVTMKICFVIKQKCFLIDFSNKYERKRISDILDELILINQNKDFGPRSSQFPDCSIEMSDWDWQESIPKDYELLKEGDIMQEGDKEYSSSSKNNYWGDVSWYNVGKPVGTSPGITVVDKGLPDKHIPGHIDPVICRKQPNR